MHPTVNTPTLISAQSVELQIWNSVVKPKVSGCFRSEDRARDYLKIMSYVGAAHKQGCNAYDAIRNALFNEPVFSQRAATKVNIIRKFWLVLISLKYVYYINSEV